MILSLSEVKAILAAQDRFSNPQIFADGKAYSYTDMRLAIEKAERQLIKLATVLADKLEEGAIK